MIDREKFDELHAAVTVLIEMEEWLADIPNVPHRFLDPIFETCSRGVDNITYRMNDIYEGALEDGPLKERIRKMVDPNSADELDENIDVDEEWAAIKDELDKLAGGE